MTQKVLLDPKTAVIWKPQQKHPNAFSTLFFVIERNYGEAQSHFLHANSGQQCATMLVEYSVTSGYPSESDLFVAQAVLQ